ncbi:PD-XK nuclease superfamily-domain-containing protein, partial [Baffinella frigidus]
EIRDLAGLDTHLPGICARIFAALACRENERTYQGCLKLDLESAGVRVDQEVQISLIYKGQPVGNRRCDLLLTTADGQRAVIEIKAVGAGRLDATHMRQLYFYMLHMGVDRGYLINFPHQGGFPDVPASNVFSQERLLGFV